MTATNTNYASPLPHQVCGRCHEGRRVTRDPNYVCASQRCVDSASTRPPPEAETTYLDGGRPAHRDRIAAASPPPNADAADIRVECKACGTYLMVPPSTAADPTQVRALLAGQGWTSSGFCGDDCARNAPKPTAGPIPNAGAPVADRSYQAAWAAARRRAGLPMLEIHRGLLSPEPAPTAPSPPPAPPPPPATKGARGAKSNPLGSE